MELNEDGELIENTMILDDGSVIFIDEHRMSDREQLMLRCAIRFVDDIEEKYGTTDIFELMDAGITKHEMLVFLGHLKILNDHGFVE